MKNTFTLACSTLFACASVLSAQAPGSQNHPPVINKDLSVTFTIDEPNAKDVRFFGDIGVGAGQTPPFTKVDGTSLWTFRSQPLDPGTYHYSFLVDGVLTPDPSNSGQRDWRNFIPWVSLLDVRGPDPFPYDPDVNVPHGKLHIETFVSATLKKCVPVYVYTPPGYGAFDHRVHPILQSDPGDGLVQRYPVLYMLHGTGGTASQWSSDGRMEHLADNLIAAGRMQPMILVSPDANIPGNSLPLFEQYMVQELIPYIDQNYRTLPMQQSRGILGQSRGGNQAFHVALKHPELFSSLGVFHNALPALTTQTYPALQNVASLNAQIPLIVLNGADQDTLVTFQSFMDAHNRLVSLGIAHVLQVFPGDHSWFNFRREFIDFVTRL